MMRCGLYHLRRKVKHIYFYSKEMKLFMAGWDPSKGDYIKKNAIKESRRRKIAELKKKIVIYGLVVVMIAVLVYCSLYLV